jgi:exodeoxyribonuclease VII large subunit
MPDTPYPARILSVSEITRSIKALLEQTYPMVWVRGEISNLRQPTSGHLYFTLKDSAAQISTVMFKGSLRHLRFTPRDGLAVIGMGRLSVFEPRGTYQIILEYLDPAGAGAMQLAFERLKRQLADEGLFDPRHKKPLPFLPRKIAVITSPTGAVLHDTLRIVHQRFPNLPVVILPVRVQGESAAREIVQAIELVNTRSDVDVVILARGGGSLEDLQAFNTEAVARAIFASLLPVVSAIGHETDTTIADFVADCRAPTPSAAAEMVAPDKGALQIQHQKLQDRLKVALLRSAARCRQALQKLHLRLKDPRRRIQDLRLRLDDREHALTRAMGRCIRQRRDRLERSMLSLRPGLLSGRLQRIKAGIEQLDYKLLNSMYNKYAKAKTEWRTMDTRLRGLSPLAILARGYSITRRLPDGRIVRDSSQVASGRRVHVTLASGALVCRVEGNAPHGPQDV